MKNYNEDRWETLIGLECNMLIVTNVYIHIRIYKEDYAHSIELDELHIIHTKQRMKEREKTL